ncbi:hypothetical protein [Lysobacter xanthus]
MIKSTTSRRLAAIAVCVMLLAGCGASDPPGNDAVEYDGGVLRVDGREFRAEPNPDEKVYPTLRGRIVVQPRPQHDPEAVALALEWVQRYGLTVEGRSKEGWILVKVPDGYEQQWAAAFSMTNPAQVSATTDGKLSPTPIAPYVAPPDGASGAVPAEDDGIKGPGAHA